MGDSAYIPVVDARAADPKVRVAGATTARMGLATDLVNGLVSLVVSVGITVALADDDDGPWELTDVALAVGISAFLSGFFTSYFAK